MRKWANAAILQEKVSEYDILNGKSYMDWIGAAVIRHKDLEPLREFAGVSLLKKKTLQNGK